MTAALLVLWLLLSGCDTTPATPRHPHATATPRPPRATPATPRHPTATPRPPRPPRATPTATPDTTPTLVPEPSNQTGHTLPAPGPRHG